MMIQEISIDRSLMHARAWRMRIVVGDYSFEGYFDELGGFVTAVTEAMKFFAVRMGKLRVKDAGFTRPVAPGNSQGQILPGDRAQ